jgi:nucleotide-binding universal stress UspA family protein
MTQPILVPIDGSPFSERAIPAAVAIAKRNRLRVELILIHEPFVPSPQGPQFLPLVSPVLDAEWRSRRGAYMRDLVARLQKTTAVPVSGSVMDGAVADGIAEHARAHDARLIVLATHGDTPGSRLWVGSVPRAIARLAPSPVLFVKPGIDSREPEPESFARVLVALDGSAASDSAIEYATMIAGKTGVSYTLIRVVTAVEEWEYGSASWAAGENLAITEARAYLARHARRLRRHGYSVATQVLREGRPADAILEFATENDIDLIALTTHARSVTSRLFRRSVADRIAREPWITALMARKPEAAAATPAVRRSRKRAQTLR